MKIVLWIGNEANQKALANKIHRQFPLAGIVTETARHKRRLTLVKIVEKVIEKLFLQSNSKAWWDMKKYYDEKYPAYPNVKRIDVTSINSDEAYKFTRELQPDLIIVSGTRLIKEKLLSLKPAIGILNLHTGLSPFVKGGPNCTNWCIATNQLHLIGNTIMWIDAGIDTGNIVTTELTNFTGDEDLPAVHLKVMEHAHSLYLKAINLLSKGNSSNFPQDSLGNGVTYYTKQWGLKQKFALKRNFKTFGAKIKSKEVEALKKGVKTVEI